MKRPMFLISCVYVSTNIVASFFNVKILIILHLFPIVFAAIFGMRKEKWLVLLSVVSFFALFNYTLRTQGEFRKISSFAEKPITLEGEILQVQEKQNTTALKIKVIENDMHEHANFLVMINTYDKETYHKGDRILVDTILKRPKNTWNFDAESYYLSEGIFLTGNASKISMLQETEKFNLFDLKQRLIFSTNQVLESRYSGIINAILYGDKSQLDENFQDKLSDLGVGHILAISGLHISILAGMFMLLMKLFRWNHYGNFVILFFMILYGALVGFLPSVTRAILMFGVYLLGDFFGRRTYLFHTVMFTGMLLLCFNPFLNFSPSFWLSFLSVISVALANGYTKIILQKIAGISSFWKKVLKIFIFSFFMSLFMVPVLGYYFQKINIFSFLANIILVPLLTPLLILGGCTSVFQFLNFSVLAKFFGLLAGLLIQLCYKMVDIFHELLYLPLYVMKEPILIVMMFTVLVLLLVYLVFYPKEKLKCITLGWICCTLVFYLLFTLSPYHTIVKQGKTPEDSIVYFSQDQMNIVISSLEKEKQIEDILWFCEENNIRKIDLLLVPKGKEKVVSKLRYLTEDFPIQQIFLPQTLAAKHEEQGKDVPLEELSNREIFWKEKPVGKILVEEEAFVFYFLKQHQVMIYSIGVVDDKYLKQGTRIIGESSPDLDLIGEDMLKIRGRR